MTEVFKFRRRDPRSTGPTGPRDPRAGMSRPGVATVQPMPVTQPSAPTPAVPSGNPVTNVSPAAPTAGAIGRALGPGTSDQEKVKKLIFTY